MIWLNMLRIKSLFSNCQQSWPCQKYWNIPNEHFKTSLLDNSNTSEIKNLVYELFNKNNFKNENIVISNMRHFEALELAYELLKIQKDFPVIFLRFDCNGHTTSFVPCWNYYRRHI